MDHHSRHKETCSSKLWCREYCVAAHLQDHETRSLFNRRIKPADTSVGFTAKITHTESYRDKCERPKTLEWSIFWAKVGRLVRFRKVS